MSEEVIVRPPAKVYVRNSQLGAASGSLSVDMKSSQAIDIVMATYNGAAFIEEQIRSLQSQTRGDWTLWIRDDGSNDETPALLGQLARDDTRLKILPTRTKGPAGPVANFSALLEALPSSSRYVFFCDQDDVWLPEKLDLEMTVLLRAEQEKGPQTPLAVHSDLRLVDAHLVPIANSAKTHMGFRPQDPHSFPKLLAQNFVTGCTLGINRALLDLALPLPPETLMHDWWLALIAAAAGELIYLPQATVLYRQHGKNASGLSRPKTFGQGIRSFSRNMGEFEELMQKRFEQSEALIRHLEAKVQVPALDWLKDYHRNLRSNRIHGIWHAVTGKVALQGWARTGAYYLLLLKNGFPGPT